MNDGMRIGRIVGLLMLLQVPGGILGNFVLTAPVFAAPGFLVNAAPHATNVALSALVGIATSALSVAIAITLLPVLRRGSESLGLWLLSLAAVNLALAAVEQVTLLSMLSLSQAYAAAAAPDETLYQALRGVVAAARNWAHYVRLVVSGGALLVLFTAFLRLALVPRLLAGIGVAAVLLQMIAVAKPLFGGGVLFPLLAPIGLVMLATAAWLLARGLDTRALARGEIPAFTKSTAA
jgi:Domain of unknown function (DUF4386)